MFFTQSIAKLWGIEVNNALTSKEMSWQFCGTIKFVSLFFASREFFNLWGNLLVDGVKSLEKNWAMLYEGEFIKDTKRCFVYVVNRIK